MKLLRTLTPTFRSTTLRNSPSSLRPFTLSAARCYSSPSTPPAGNPLPAGPGESGSKRQDKEKGAVGPFTLKAAALFGVTGLGLWYYFQTEKAALKQRKDQETATAKIGRPKIGGPFTLTDQDGKEWSSEKMMGRWSLVYFGFTNCPDICPEELDKMGLVVTSIAKSHSTELLPIFITCDPARDDVKAVKAYVKDFHPSLVGLTGTYESIKKCCKAYRVYFSTPPNAKATDDYLVDHSIFFYLMDPNGKFVDAFGRSMGPQEVEGKVARYLEQWDTREGRGPWSE
ncbi:SCO1/SenC-domain-containing protein [Leucosporidium creatinivorum]|uniref:SCO1/SenC-domain-containing protein n=1 Tax=Leucosporidium creatinivorum TaxID=106004 RepID=A0A1Y2E5U1_9BASI|nr:SCO1/SenC-domain-containing protein [Leucosporidium creatinivorum]